MKDSRLAFTRFAGRSLRLINRSGYDTADLRRFFSRGLQATGVRTRGLTIHVVSAPGRTKGCADVAGKRMTIAIASPSRMSVRRLAMVFVHEAEHLRGMHHADMGRVSSRLLYSPDSGSTPGWARGARLRYRGRAPKQLSTLRRDRLTRA